MINEQNDCSEFASSPKDPPPWSSTSPIRQPASSQDTTHPVFPAFLDAEHLQQRTASLYVV